MRKLQSGLFVSLDGVVEAPEKWTFPYFSDEVGQVVGDSMQSADTMLLGRRTYEEFAAYWSDKTAEDDPFADYINDTPKYVVSTTLTSVDWRNATLIEGDVAAGITKLKEQTGKNIGMTGSATLVRWLLREGLLDELWLLLYPIVVGGGKHLFEDWAGEMPLELADSKTFGNGVVSLTYRRAEA